MKLSKRLAWTIDLLSRGYSTKEIAGIMGVKPQTVRNYISRTVEKMGARGRTEAALMWQKRGK